MAKLEIVHYPHPALRYTSRPVTRIDQDLRRVVREMFDLMYEARGIGLAANQVGLPFRFFVLNLTADPVERDQERVFINPEILASDGTVEDEEGCLSFPGIYAKVKRAKKIRYRAMDLSGRTMEGEASDLFGRAIQHETDHLAGRLFIDHLSPEAMATISDRVAEVEARYRGRQGAGELESDDSTSRLLREMDALNRILPPGTRPGGVASGLD